MERVTFLVEQSGDQLACLLNPESLVVRRKAGVKARESASGQLTDPRLSDRPLLFTGGGVTEIELELLFDVALAGSSINANNVQDLTGPLWNLAENSDDTGWGRPPLIRFLWGKTFNVPGIVAGVAERLERFSVDGVPNRSWMRMRIVRVDEKALERSSSPPQPSPASLMETAADALPSAGGIHSVTGGLQEPSPEIEGSGSSIATASGIMSTAFDASGAAAMVASARATVSETIDSLSDGANQLSSTEEENSSAAEQLSAASETFERALETAAQGIRNGNLTAVGEAVKNMFDAAGTAATAAKSLVSKAGKAVARQVNTALDAVGPAAEKLLLAGQAVVRRVVQTSARVLAAAVAQTDKTINHISTSAKNLASAASEGAQKAGELLKSGINQISDALERIRSAGEFAAVELLPGAFQQLSRTVDQLWSAGMAASAELVSSAVEEMAIKLKNMKGASEAIRSVTEHAASALLRDVSEQLQATVAHSEESNDVSRLSPIKRRVSALLHSIFSAKQANQSETIEEVREAIRPLEDILENVEASGEISRLSEVADFLPIVDDAAEALKAFEQEETSSAITAAVRVQEELPPGESAVSETGHPATERHQSERLDQIAFRNYGSPAYWRLLAFHNDIAHPLRLPVGLQLHLPPATRSQEL